jgi:hypothetical protein
LGFYYIFLKKLACSYFKANACNASATLAAGIAMNACPDFTATHCRDNARVSNAF